MTMLQKVASTSGLAIALALCCSSSSLAAPSSGAAAVHAADDAWVKAYNAGQLENVVALYDENAVIYPPGSASQNGRAAIHEFFTKDMAGFTKSGLSFALDANPDGGVVDTGWYFSVSRKVAGKWLYVRDSWNSNKPAAPAAPAGN